MAPCETKWLNSWICLELPGGGKWRAAAGPAGSLTASPDSGGCAAPPARFRGHRFGHRFLGSDSSETAREGTTDCMAAMTAMTTLAIMDCYGSATFSRLTTSALRPVCLADFANGRSLVRGKARRGVRH